MSPETFPEFATKVQVLHNIYCRESRSNRDLCQSELRAWGKFMQAGLTAQDLLITTRFLREAVEDGRRPEICLEFRNFVGNLREFQNLLHLAQHPSQSRK